MNKERKSFSHLLQERINQEISHLQERPESIVADFEANERVAQELELAENLEAVSRFLSERLGIDTRFSGYNERPNVIDPETMMTIVEGEPEYKITLTWKINGKEREFTLVVANSGAEVRILRGDNPAVVFNPYDEDNDLLNYDQIHEEITKLLFDEINSDFSVARSFPRTAETAQATA